MNEQPLHNTLTGSVPVPDPTLLTTQALNAQIAALKELIFTRLDGMDEALKVARDNYTRVPTDIDKAIGPMRELFEAWREGIDERFLSLNKLIDQRFSNIGDQFDERDIRTAQSEIASKEAIAAALQAAKEAVGENAKNVALLIDKLEAAITKQIENIARAGEASSIASQSTISDLKDRVTRIESLGIGAVTQKAETRAEGGAMWMVIAGVVGIFGLMIGAIGIAIAVAAK